ncbi:SgcJ/EcaC family oxidoreductase [Litoribacter alkaliphilus]|uniref:SgcJ/EcaC family oxidoreductase n=1 Tax=Litoribacter ruber TaxID=702568 RepID=A0AAP2CEB7_9BACT|nr:SgcJ/EcaC family oxidoreductase [Litoribacter alkaliphilus]MBS9522796.1 SgcJ/EcaC family oxidoreductase [Litoribacter alkaliphilus]
MSTILTDENINDVILNRNELFMETFRKGDAQGIGNLYTEEGQVLPQNGMTAKGRNAISEFWKGAMNTGIKSIEMNLEEVERHGDTAIEVSNAKLFDENNQLIDQVKYIVIWKKENGEWKLHRDIFNSNGEAK